MTRQQQWATRAFEAVADVCKNHNDYKDKCLSQFKSLPNLLLQSGAVQTVAFLTAKAKGKNENDSQKQEKTKNKENEYKIVLDKLAYVYQSSADKLLKNLRGDDKKDDLHRYLSMSRDLIDCAIWLRRFAQANDESNGGEQQ